MKNSAKTLFLCLFVLLADVNLSLSQSLSPEAKKLKAAYVQLKINPGSKPKQVAYLNAFPQNKQQFVDVFQSAGNGQLASEASGYITTLTGMANAHPNEVVDKMVNICKDLSKPLDPNGTMQHSMTQLGVLYAKAFSNKVKALPADQKNNLVKFLADVEDHRTYLIYQELIDALKRISDGDLAGKLVEARTAREKQGGH